MINNVRDQSRRRSCQLLVAAVATAVLVVVGCYTPNKTPSDGPPDQGLGPDMGTEPVVVAVIDPNDIEPGGAATLTIELDDVPGMSGQPVYIWLESGDVSQLVDGTYPKPDEWVTFYQQKRTWNLEAKQNAQATLIEFCAMSKQTPPKKCGAVKITTGVQRLPVE